MSNMMVSPSSSSFSPCQSTVDFFQTSGRMHCFIVEDKTTSFLTSCESWLTTSSSLLLYSISSSSESCGKNPVVYDFYGELWLHTCTVRQAISSEMYPIIISLRCYWEVCVTISTVHITDGKFKDGFLLTPVPISLGSMCKYFWKEKHTVNLRQ